MNFNKYLKYLKFKIKTNCFTKMVYLIKTKYIKNNKYTK